MKHNPPSPDKSGYGGQALRSPTKFFLSLPYFFLNPFRQVKFYLSLQPASPFGRLVPAGKYSYLKTTSIIFNIL
jgi:hypothetical protein